MEKLFIPQIAKAEHGTITIEFKQFIQGLDTTTPVQGWLRVRHGGNFLEVTAQAHGIITLECDRTLVQFNHRLAVDTQELILLSENAFQDQFGKEIELSFEDLNETLPPLGYFEPELWLYEQLCLSIPFPKIAPDTSAVHYLDPTSPAVEVDRRWAALAALYSAE
ncbi:MAG: YceD family protein [Pseudanabaenaceae cyanobacterium bins.68]|nr:YceD family protein [Pseudanabaenaceae cyanobacterium bins.68]